MWLGLSCLLIFARFFSNLFSGKRHDCYDSLFIFASISVFDSFVLILLRVFRFTLIYAMWVCFDFLCLCLVYLFVLSWFHLTVNFLFPLLGWVFDIQIKPMFSSSLNLMLFVFLFLMFQMPFSLYLSGYLLFFFFKRIFLCSKYFINTCKLRLFRLLIFFLVSEKIGEKFVILCIYVRWFFWTNYKLNQLDDRIALISSDFSRHVVSN